MEQALMLAEVNGEIIAAMAVTGSVAIALVSIIVGAIKSTAVTRQREQSRREIAAYIAEGSMSPDEGERLLNAGPVRQRVKV